MNKFFIPTFVLVSFGIFASLAQATPIDSFSEFYSQGGTIDKGNAPAPYAEASNKMGLWQRLGDVNKDDDGVSWSVGGSTFGTTESLVLGQEVTFKFDLWQSNTGTHDYDQLISFIDWNHDGSWSFDKDSLWQDDKSSETIIYKKDDAIKQTNNDYKKDDNYITMHSTLTEYFVTLTVPEDNYIGSTWMRTRVHCWHTSFPNVTPYGELAQGETLDMELNIVAAPVPEPATMLLFGTGLVGLVGARLKRKKK